MSNSPRKSRHCEGFPEQEIIIGKIVSVNFPRRELRIAPETSHPERFHELQEIFLKAEGGRIIRLTLRGIRAAGSTFVAIVETDDEDELTSARKAFVIVSHKDRFQLPENEYYIDDLVGLVVKDEGGTIIGRLSEVLETPANDIYRVIDDKAREILLPAIEDVILHVDIEGGEMRVDTSGLE